MSDTTLIQPGTPAPDMTLTDQDGAPISLADFRGQKLILFVYAEDNSGTCTKEACNLRDGYAALQARGFAVVGVSPDPEKSHRKFIDKQQLPYRLISDPETRLIQALGAWGEKKMYGRTYMGILRATFILDEQGIITHVIDKVKSADHTRQILDLAGQ
ncbi:MAG: thioredoxin-dependent thiol peroxidase [Bacteroidia bacterium]|nr:thioredoxin-dependent thiol peroxidase [Bacteroidia bacterium]